MQINTKGPQGPGIPYRTWSIVLVLVRVITEYDVFRRPPIIVRPGKEPVRLVRMFKKYPTLSTSDLSQVSKATRPDNAMRLFQC